MRYKIFNLALLLLMCYITSCKKQTTPEALSVEKANVYSEEYYANLRSYKASDHAICFGWYQAYKTDGSPSFGNHFMGLPDSMDIVSLWTTVPSGDTAIKSTDTNNRAYLPVANEEMRYIQKVKGTKIVMCKIVRMVGTQYSLDDQGIQNYAMWCVNAVLDNELDGLDMDYEPEGDFLSGANFTKFVTIIGQYLGPKSNHPDKYLICDFYTTTPPKEIEPFTNYFVRQAYNSASATVLQNDYNLLSSWCTPKKFIVTEQMGDYWQTGGVAFTEADGNTLTADGTQLYSLQGMARWNPKEGRKGGFGGYYFEYEYNLSTDYTAMRRGIQDQNPSAH